MNSVFLGPAERQVTKLEFAGTDFQGNPIEGQTVFVGELLDWVQRFAAEEGPRLLREGGKEGVIQAFQPTIARLINLFLMGRPSSWRRRRTRRVDFTLPEFSAR